MLVFRLNEKLIGLFLTVASLHFQKNLLPIQKIQERPTYCHRSAAPKKWRPCFGKPAYHAFEQKIGSI